MEKRLRRTESCLVLAICLSILALPTYFRSNRLSQTKLVSSDLSFERPGQEEGLPDHEKVKAFRPAAFFTRSLLDTHISEPPSHLLSHTLSPRQKKSVLRC